MEILIDSTTGAVTSEKVEVEEYAGFRYPSFPATIWTWGLSGETIDIQYPTDRDDMPWVTVDSLTVDNFSLGLNSPMIFRVVKPVTANAVGVAFSAVRKQFQKKAY